MFRCDRTDRHTEQGLLEVAGVEWTEHRMWVSSLLLGFAQLCMLASIFTLIAGPMFGWPALAVTAALWTPMLWWHRVDVPGVARRLEFTREGEVQAPYWLSIGHRRTSSIPGHHAAIISIEARQVVSGDDARRTVFTHGVAVIRRNGSMFYVASRLHPDQAMMVAVQLTQALNEMRASLANGDVAVASQSRSEPGSAMPTKPILVD